MDDLVDAFALARRHIGKLSGRAFNIGGGPGNTVSLLELIRRLEDSLERRIELSFDAWRVGDQRYYVSDTSKFGAAGAGTGGGHGAPLGRARLSGMSAMSRQRAATLVRPG